MNRNITKTITNIKEKIKKQINQINLPKIKQIKELEKYITKKNMGFLFIMLSFLWVILYFIPDTLFSIFNTLLGNLLLICIILFIFTQNHMYGFIVGGGIIALYRFYYLSKVNSSSKPNQKIQNRENFQNNNNNNNNVPLTPESIEKFLVIQNTLNRQTNFDIDKLNQQVTQQELDTFLQKGSWPWSSEVQKLYTDALQKNVFIRNYPKMSLQNTQTIYNQNAILEVLSSQTKEGQFLINGISIHDNKPNPLEDLPSGFGSFGYHSGLISPMKDVIKCNIDPYGNNSHLEKIHYTGKGGILGEQTKTTTALDYNQLETEIPGFTFLNQPCNPCKVFNNPADYSCAFDLQLKEKNNANTNINTNINTDTSSIWKYLWNLNK
jgi:hypothetical protein